MAYNKLMSNKTPEQKEQLKELIQISQPLFKALQELVETEIEETDVTSMKDFESPSWALETAYKQGLKKGLTTLKKYVIL